MYSLRLLVSKFLGIISLWLVTSDATEPTLPNLTREPRSWGGEEALIEEFPYIVNLDYYSSQSCGGSILTSYFILTAAHCIHGDSDPDAYKVRAGSSFRDRGGSLHYVRTIIKHPNYVHSRMNPVNDLALLKLLNPIIMNNKTKKTIQIFETGKESKNSATLAGWGCIDQYQDFRPFQLRSLKMNIIDKNHCREIYSSDIQLNHDEICASASSTDHVTRGFCKGDSGGPLAIDGKLAGVAKAIGKNHDSKHWPNKFTEVSYHRNWINANVNYKLKVTESIYDWSINKIDDLKRNITEIRNNQSSILFELLGPYWEVSGLEQLISYCSDPLGVVYKTDTYDRFDVPIDAWAKETLNGLRVIPECNAILEREKINFRKNLYPHLCKEVSKQLIDDKDKLASVQDFINIENVIKDCFKNENAHIDISLDRSCSKSKIEKKLQEVNNLVKSTLNVVKNVGEFAIEKNQNRVGSLFDVNVVQPIQKCNRSP